MLAPLALRAGPCRAQGLSGVGVPFDCGSRTAAPEHRSTHDVEARVDE